MHSRRRGKERGRGLLEYVLIAIVAGLVVLFAISRLGGGVSSRYDCSSKTTETARVVEGQSPVRPGCEEQLAKAELPKPPPELLTGKGPSR
jgi:Flp pilus assembly pilin Flp